MSSAVDTSTKDAWGVVVGAPARLLRLEGAALLAGSLLAYTTTGRPWWHSASSGLRISVWTACSATD